MQTLLTFFSKNISIYTIFNDQSFHDTLTNDIVSFEQLGPEVLKMFYAASALLEAIKRRPVFRYGSNVLSFGTIGLIYYMYKYTSAPSYYPVSILYKSIAGRYRPIRVADGPRTALYRFIKNAS